MLVAHSHSERKRGQQNVLASFLDSVKPLTLGLRRPIQDLQLTENRRVGGNQIPVNQVRRAINPNPSPATEPVDPQHKSPGPGRGLST